MTSTSTDADLLALVSSLSPTAFENLTLDLMRAVGFRNLVWRTPGADGGRDIEAEKVITDPTDTDSVQKWYIECKRYSTSVDWPTVWRKIAFADSHGADFLLLVTNSQPSPQCETEINRWNSDRRRPTLRVWRGYDLPRFIRRYEDVAFAHGLAPRALNLSSLSVGFSSVLSKLALSAYGSHVFGTNPDIPLTAAASLSELFNQRLISIETYGKFKFGTKIKDLSDWPWLSVTGDPTTQEEVGFKAIVSCVRHLTQSPTMSCKIIGTEVVLSGNKPKYLIDPKGSDLLHPVLQWSMCDNFKIEDEKVTFLLRGQNE